MSETCDGCPAEATHFLCDKCCHEEPDAINRENDKLRAQRDALAEALRSLVEQIDVVGAHQEYRAVWECAQLHRGPYRGPQYEEQWKAARAALKKLKEEP